MANLILCSIGGYAFARLRFPGREVLFMLVLATLMIPDQLRLVPVFVMLSGWGHVGLVPGLHGDQARAGDQSLLHAPVLPDDPEATSRRRRSSTAPDFKTYWQVMLPLAGPALAAITILPSRGSGTSSSGR